MTQRSVYLPLEYACAVPAACLVLSVELCLGTVQALDNLMAGRTTIVVVRGVLLCLCCTTRSAWDDACP